MSTLALIVALGVLVAAVYWFALRGSSRKIVGQYRRLSRALGLELNEPAPAVWGFIRPEPSLYGELDGREISLSVPGKGLQNTRQIETVLKLQVNDRRFAAQVAPNAPLDRFRQPDGRDLERWQSGDPAFDSAWILRAAPRQPTGEVFDAAIRERMASLMQAGKGSLHIGNGVIAYAELGLISNDAKRQRFEAMVAFAGSLAEAIERA